MADSEELVQRTVRLRRGSLVRIAEGPGMLVRVRRGSVWITEEGDPRDHFVGAGGQFRIRRRGTALISALESSVLSFAGTDLVEPLALSA